MKQLWTCSRDSPSWQRDNQWAFHCPFQSSNRGEESNWTVFDDATVRHTTTEEDVNFSETNWRCAAYRYTTSATNPKTTEKIKFDAVFLVRKNEQQKFKLQRYYSCCKVHWKRSVARVKRNHALVPADEISQNHFQHLVNILASEKSDEERFYQTISEMKEQFPHVTDWIDWYLANNRGNCFFPFMTQGGISGFGNNTNAQEGGGRWLQAGLGKKKGPMIEVLQHLYAAGKAINDDVIAVRDGNIPSYQRHRTNLNPIERDAERKAKRTHENAAATKKRKAEAYKNDGRPPDTTKQLFTPPLQKKKQKRTYKKPRGRWNFNDFAMPWSYKFDGLSVTNTCAMDSFLQLLFLLRKYSVIDQHLFYTDKVLTEVLNTIDAYQFGAARHKWLQHVMKACAVNPDIKNRGKTWSTWGTTCHHLMSCKLFQMTIKYHFDSYSTHDCPNDSLYDNANGESMANMVHRISCLDVHWKGTKYDDIQDFFDSEYHYFNRKQQNKMGVVSRGRRCGTSIELFGRNQGGCNGYRKYRQELVAHPVILELFVYGDNNETWSSPSEVPQSFSLFQLAVGSLVLLGQAELHALNALSNCRFIS